MLAQVEEILAAQQIGELRVAAEERGDGGAYFGRLVPEDGLPAL
jgi:hypothetical protein